MREQAHRSDAHGHVVGESVISEGFSRRLEGVMSMTNVFAAYGNRAECHAVDARKEDEYGPAGLSGHNRQKWL